MLINFDFDGVVADTFDALLRICIVAQQQLDEGRTPVAADLRTVKNLTFEGVAELLDIPPEAIPEYRKIAFKLQQEQQDDVLFFPEMGELLKKLALTCDLAIITAGRTETVRNHLIHHGVSDSVTRITGGEKGLSKEEAILVNLEHFEATASESFMVGDAVSDIRHGKAAKVKTIGVSWGFQSRELLSGEAPDVLVDSPQQLLACFDR